MVFHQILADKVQPSVRKAKFCWRGRISFLALFYGKQKKKLNKNQKQTPSTKLTFQIHQSDSGPNFLARPNIAVINFLRVFLFSMNDWCTDKKVTLGFCNRFSKHTKNVFFRVPKKSWKIPAKEKEVKVMCHQEKPVIII